jgi:glutathione synthase/RimK-type ligase-like ATP-grasp enzyme
MEAFLDCAPALAVNRYDADRQAGNRLSQSLAARSVGLSVPETIVTQDADKAKRFLIGRNAVAKAISFGILSTTGDAIAHTSRVTASLDYGGLKFCPVLLQTEVSKKCEWRVTTVGTQVFAARTRSDAVADLVDWRNSDNADDLFEAAELPGKIVEKLLLLCRRTGILFGAHDLIETPDGDFVFLETNPAGQWGWLELNLAMPIGAALADLLITGHGFEMR